MHTAPIRRIGVDRAGRFLVTGSDDKTVRVWSLVSAKLLRTLGPPIGPGNEGNIYAVAISPDGAVIAAAGFTGYQWDERHSIYLFRRESGELFRRLTGAPNAINDLAFSPDGERLAAALGDASGVRVYRVSDGQQLGEDSDYDGQSYSVDFDGSGRLIASSYDGRLRLYDSDLKKIAKVNAPGGNRPQPWAVVQKVSWRRKAARQIGAAFVDWKTNRTDD